MEVFDAIHTRQSIGKVKPDPVPRDLLEKILSAAVQAPNHHTVRPWRFGVLTGAARERLGEAFAAALKNRKPESDEVALKAERARPLRSPVLIAVAVDKPNAPNVVEIENVCAVAAACENMLLAAHGLGLAAMWRTGSPAIDPIVKKFLGFEPDQHLIAFIYIGYPLTERTTSNRPSFEDRTVWLD